LTHDFSPSAFRRDKCDLVRADCKTVVMDRYPVMLALVSRG